MEEDDAEFPPLFRRHSKLVKVVLGVVAEYVKRLFELARRGKQDG